MADAAAGEEAGGVGGAAGGDEVGTAPVLDGDWLFPFWLERQRDPRSPDYTPVDVDASVPAVERTAGALPPDVLVPPHNRTNRDWTLIGSLGSWRRGMVDPRGLVTPREGGWSLDWWVRGEDRWRLPSREAAVRQRLVDDTPVVETVLRVPGGDVAHRAYGVRVSVDELLVVEIENASPVPVAVAFAIRPYNPLGFARVDAIALDERTNVVSVDGTSALLLPKPPAQVAWNGEVDCVTDVLQELTDPPGSARDVRGETGLAHAAFIFPLSHRSTIRVAIPLTAGPGGARGGRGRGGDVAPVQVADVSEASRVASGWRTQGDRGVRFDLPDDRLRSAVDAARRHLLLAHGGEDLVSVPGQPFDFSEAAVILAALGVFGYHDEVAQVIGTWPERQHADGWFGAEERWDANGAALHALAQHWRLTRSLDQGEETALLVARAAHTIGKKRAGSRRRGKGTPTRGAMPSGAGPRGCGPPGVWVRDAIWSCQGLHDAELLLVALAQADAAATVAELRARFEEQLRVMLAAIPGNAWPSTMERGRDGGIVANLDAVNLPLTLMAGLPGRDETLDAIRARCLLEGAVHRSLGPGGTSPRHTAMLARAELHLGGLPGDRRSWMLANASSTWAWPEAKHPTRGGGTVGAGHDGVATAWFLSLVRDMLVRESGPRHLALCTDWPRAWLGQGLEVHAAPTWFGSLSFAIRWHGERPAVLWELEPHDEQDASLAPITVTAPGLDRAWTSTEAKGEALLAVPVGAVVDGLDPGAFEGQSFV